jgi:hypothetical protein
MRVRVVMTAVAVFSAVGAPSARAEDAPEVAPPGEVASPREIGDARQAIDLTVSQMRATSLRVREQLRTTRKRGTRAQIACVDQALSRTDVGVRRARDTGDEVLAAYARNDLATARMLRGRLSELRVAQGQAAVEGASCTPNAAPVLPAAVSNQTTVKLEIDPKIAPAP